MSSGGSAAGAAPATSKLDQSLGEIIAAENKVGSGGGDQRASKGATRRDERRDGRAVRGSPYAADAATPAGQRGYRVFVGNLSYGMSWQDLKDLASKAGDVIRADVFKGPDGRSKGQGVIVFSNKSQADRAIEQLHDCEVNGRRIFLRPDRDELAGGRGGGRGGGHFGGGGGRGHNGGGRGGGHFGGGRGGYGGGYHPQQQYHHQQQQQQQYHPQQQYHHQQQQVPQYLRQQLNNSIAREMRDRAPAGCQVYIGNIPFNCSWQDVKDICAPFGHVLHCEVPEDKSKAGQGPPGRRWTRGFATVIFRHPDAASKCIETLNGHSYRGRQLAVRLDAYAEKNRPAPGSKLFVNNLPWRMSWQDLKDAFSAFGQVTRAEVNLDRATHRSRGHGTVTFANVADATAAVKGMDGKEIDGRQLSVRVDRFVSGAAKAEAAPMNDEGDDEGEEELAGETEE